MAVVGYLRVSSSNQTLQHQKYELEQFTKRNNITINRWVEETISSRKPLNKRRLGQLLDELQPNDILISTEISRLGRSMMEVMRILETCLNKDCQVWTVKENYRLGNDIQSKVLAFSFSLAGEIERQLISQRTKCSLENIRATGKKLGRPLSAQSKKLKLSRNAKKVKQMLDLGFTRYRIAKTMQVRQTTVDRFLHRMGWI